MVVINIGVLMFSAGAGHVRNASFRSEAAWKIQFLIVYGNSSIKIVSFKTEISMSKNKTMLSAIPAR